MYCEGNFREQLERAFCLLVIQSSGGDTYNVRTLTRKNMVEGVKRFVCDRGRKILRSFPNWERPADGLHRNRCGICKESMIRAVIARWPVTHAQLISRVTS